MVNQVQLNYHLVDIFILLEITGCVFRSVWLMSFYSTENLMTVITTCHTTLIVLKQFNNIQLKRYLGSIKNIEILLLSSSHGSMVLKGVCMLCDKENCYAIKSSIESCCCNPIKCWMYIMLNCIKN